MKKALLPIDKAAPLDDFKEDQCYLTTLQTLHKSMGAIIGKEVQFEAANNSVKSAYFYVNRMHVFSWTGIIVIERTHKICCVNFLDGVAECVSRYLQDTGIHEGYFALLLEVLRDLRTDIWGEKPAHKLLSSLTRFTKKLFTIIQGSPYFVAKHGDPTEAKSLEARRDIIVRGPLRMPEVVHLGRSEDAQARRMTMQKTDVCVTTEKAILEGGTKLMKAMYDDDLKLRTIKSTKDCAVALTLLQLLCGSRSRGVSFINYFVPLQDNLVKCVRLTKERSLTARRVANQTKKRKVCEDTYTSVDRPIIGKFFWTTHGEITGERAVELFMELLTATRKYLAEHYSGCADGFCMNNDKYNMHAVSDELAYGGKEIDSRQVKWLNLISMITKEVFPFTHKGMGSQMLRRIYAIYGHHVHARYTMTNVAYTFSVLGHECMNTALYYTSLIIKPDTE